MDLIEQHFDMAFEGSDGTKKLRELILSLAMQGKLVPQDPSDSPASDLVIEIRAETKRLFREGKIKEPKLLPPVTADEVPYKLPKGWEWVRLGTFLQMVNGRAFKPTEWTRSGLPIVRIQNLNNREAPFNFCDETDVKEQHIISHNEFLISWSGTPGTSFGAFIWSGGRAALNQHIFRCNQFAKPFLDEFLRRAINSRLNFLISQAQGAVGLKHVTKGTLEHMPLPLPPREEQVRIVAKLDELMARCEKLEKLRAERDTRRVAIHAAAIRKLLHIADVDGHVQARDFLSKHFGQLYTVKENVAELRKAILQLAVMGKLVPPDPKDPPARELLKQIRLEKKRLIKEVRIRESKPFATIASDQIPFLLPNGWEWVRITEVAQLITSGSRDWAQYYSDSGAIFLTMGNLSRGSYQLRMDTIRYVSPPNDSEGARTRLEEGDLLISITGDVGNLGLVPRDFGEAYINQHTCLLRLMPVCRNRYFAELLRSPLAKAQFDAPQRGIKNSFRLPDVGEMLIPLPPLPMQKRIVARIDHFMSMCDDLERAIDSLSRTHGSLLNAVMAQLEAARCA